VRGEFPVACLERNVGILASQTSVVAAVLVLSANPLPVISRAQVRARLDLRQWEVMGGLPTAIAHHGDRAGASSADDWPV